MRCPSRLSIYLGIAMAAWVSNASADELIGSVVQRHFNGAVGFHPAAPTGDDLVFDRDVFGGETVKTPGSASTVIRFADKTQIQVEANSTIVIDRFVYSTGSGNGATLI